jgi:hypothetical protein
MNISLSVTYISLINNALWKSLIRQHSMIGWILMTQWEDIERSVRARFIAQTYIWNADITAWSRSANHTPLSEPHILFYLTYRSNLRWILKLATGSSIEWWIWPRGRRVEVWTGVEQECVREKGTKLEKLYLQLMFQFYTNHCPWSKSGSLCNLTYVLNQLIERKLFIRRDACTNSIRFGRQADVTNSIKLRRKAKSVML